MPSSPASLQIAPAAPFQVHQGLYDLFCSPCTHSVAAGQSRAHRGWAGLCEHWQGRDMGPEEQLPAGTAPGSRDGQEGRELLMETLWQGRYGHLPASPAVQMPSPSNPLHLSSPTQHSPQPSGPWGLGWESPLCPADQQKRRRASLPPATGPFPTDQQSG